MTTIKFTNMSDLLKASPFDPEYDLEQSLTKKIFFDEFHVARDRLVNSLDELMESALQPNRVIFLRGFAGNGKTTFIHTYMRHRQHDRSVYIDFTPVRKHLSPETVMRTTVAELSNVEETLRFVFEHRRALRDYFSPQLLNHLATGVPDRASQEWLDDMVNAFDLRDTFAYLFVHLFRSFEKGKRTIFYFDNLDTARMEELANNFLVYFQDALSAGTYIARLPLFADKEIEFRSDFRFIFCLREANEAILNAHLSDRSGFTRAPFELTFDAGLYQDVARKRIDYAALHFPTRNVLPGGNGRFSHLLHEILKDSYFQEVFLPLQNNDYREVAGLLVKLIDQYKLSEKHASVDFELRGRLMFGMVASLITENFMNDYLRIPADPSGYCYIDRVMLTVLINASHYRRYPLQQSGDPYSLFHLVRDLLPLYSLHSILNSVARCFMSEQLRHVHLLTILDRRVATIAQFEEEYTPMIDVALNASEPQTLKIRNEVSEVKMRVNPAGFTYVRYVLPHFEFYSNLVRNKSCLFHEPLDRAKNAEGKDLYAFEAKIDCVLNQVREHAKSMKNFFDSRYRAIGINPEDFPTSKYCFRHFGRAEMPRYAGGHSHTIRVVTAHVNYIDELRRRILLDKNLPESEVRRINEGVVQRIQSYAQVLELAIDQEQAESFQKKFELHTAVIQNNPLDRKKAIDRK